MIALTSDIVEVIHFHIIETPANSSEATWWVWGIPLASCGIPKAARCLLYPARLTSSRLLAKYSSLI